MIWFDINGTSETILQNIDMIEYAVKKYSDRYPSASTIGVYPNKPEGEFREVVVVVKDIHGKVIITIGVIQREKGMAFECHS